MIFPAFYKTYLKRIIKFTLFLQTIVAISFAFFQTPHFLGIIKGIKFSQLSILLMIVIRTLEWVNFIAIGSLLAAFFLIIGTDVNKNNIRVLILQMGHNIKHLIHPMLMIGALFGTMCFIVDGFLLPKGNLYLKTQLVEIAKEQLITSLQPKHIVNIQNWNFAISKKINEHEISGILLNKETTPQITIFVEHAKFVSRKNLTLQIKNGIGEVKHNDLKIKFNFDNCKFQAPQHMIQVESTKRNLNILQLDIYELIIRTLMSIIAILLPIAAFIMLFGSLKQKLLATMNLTTMMFIAINIFPMSLLAFFVSSIMLLIIYRGVKV